MVEDNSQDEILILHALRKANLANDVFVVRDGQQAIDYLFCQGEFAERDEDDLPAIVLLDMGLPRLGGLEVLDRLRADACTELLPVAIFTSSDEERDRMHAYEKGANSFVRKPLKFTEFARAVAGIGVYWMAANAPSSG